MTSKIQGPAAAVQHCRATLVRLVAGSLLAGALALTVGAGVASADIDPRAATLEKQAEDLARGTKCVQLISIGARAGFQGAGAALITPDCAGTLKAGTEQGLAFFECVQRYSPATCAGNAG